VKECVRDLEQRRAQAQILATNDTTANVVPLRRQHTAAGEFTDFVRAVFVHLPPGIIVDNWYKGRLYHLNGLSGPSQRADSIECLGHYFFYGDPSRGLPPLGYGYEQEREWAIREFLIARNNGQSEEINRRRSDALDQVERATHWRPPHKSNAEPIKYVPKQPIAWRRENANRKSDARERITVALAELKLLQRSFTTVELQQAAACSRTTLYKHADIWRQDYDDLADGFFAFCTHEYNDVEGAGCSKTEPLPVSQKNFAPPGLLAARRVAYEISMRIQRSKDRSRKSTMRANTHAEDAWREAVSSVIARRTENVEDVRSQLVILTGYLAVAPTYECQQWILELLKSTRLRLNECSATPYLVKPPPQSRLDTL
jgi:hypothetical protein